MSKNKQNQSVAQSVAEKVAAAEQSALLKEVTEGAPEPEANEPEAPQAESPEVAELKAKLAAAQAKLDDLEQPELTGEMPTHYRCKNGRIVPATPTLHKMRKKMGLIPSRAPKVQE